MPSMTQSIEKLRKKLDKDPNSLIFVQLAEELRKEGNLEEALRILKAGLSRHSNYWSARVTLGRIYHQMGNRDGACEELEKVISAVPDHLLANRLLADIYMELNRPIEALKRLKIVQMITPADQALKDQIESLSAQIPPDPLPDVPNPVLLPEVQIESEPVEQNRITSEAVASVDEDTGQSENEGYAPTIQMQIPDFLEKTEVPVASLQKEVDGMPASEASIAEAEVNPTEVEEPAEAEMFAAPLEPPSDTTLRSEDPYLPDTLILDSSPQELDEQEMEESDENFESASDSEELSTLANLLMSAEESLIPDGQRFDELDPEYSTEREGEPFVRTGHQDRTQPIQEEEEGLEEAEELTTETLAELYLNQGLTDKALKVYQRLLLQDPDNPQLLNRFQELSGKSNPTMQSEAELAEEVVLIENHESEMSAQAYQQSPPDRRAEERRRKIHTLENWLSSIRRERE